MAKLLAELAELKARLGRHSRNSSLPPSSDPPAAPPRPTREPTGRKRGGQPGHKKHERILLPPERVKNVMDCLPEACRRCGGSLVGRDPTPERHQVVEVPRVVAEADEFRLHSLCCERCGITTQGVLPAGVPATMIGARLQAIIGVCSGAFRLSKRMTQDLLANFFEVDVSLGTIINTEQATSAALAGPVVEATEAVRKQAVVYADETGWRERLQKAWLWVASTPTLAVFLVRRHRSGEVARELLGELFAGILTTDRWSAYRFVHYLRRQLCWAHLKRDFASFEDYGIEAKRIGVALQDATKRVFRLWNRVRDGTLRRTTFRAYLRPVQEEIHNLLREGIHCPSKKVSGMCREILGWQHSLWTFVRHDGVDPTNNAAERALRHAVVWRKSSYGTDSESGSRFVERMLTVVQSLRLQKRNVLDYVQIACEAHLHGNASPSLLPPMQFAAAA